MRLAPEVTFEDAEEIHKVFYEPLGVAAVITPWNFPQSNFVMGALQPRKPDAIIGSSFRVLLPDSRFAADAEHLAAHNVAIANQNDVGFRFIIPKLGRSAKRQETQ